MLQRYLNPTTGRTAGAGVLQRDTSRRAMPTGPQSMPKSVQRDTPSPNDIWASEPGRFSDKTDAPKPPPAMRSPHATHQTLRDDPPCFPSESDGFRLRGVRGPRSMRLVCETSDFKARRRASGKQTGYPNRDVPYAGRRLLGGATFRTAPHAPAPTVAAAHTPQRVRATTCAPTHAQTCHNGAQGEPHKVKRWRAPCAHATSLKIRSRNKSLRRLDWTKSPAWRAGTAAVEFATASSK